MSDHAPVAALDDGIVRRAKALATTAPLHDLDTRKSSLAGDMSVYQMSELGLRTIDLVTVGMDFDRGVTHETVLTRLLPHVADQAPDRRPAEHRKVAEWVLDNLINVGSADRGFSVTYGTYTADQLSSGSGYTTKLWHFKLLVEGVDADGELFLRASDEAINVLVGALNTDVESAQIAAFLQLESLIDRGRLDDARAAAEQAQLRTVQYAERLRVDLEATRRDVRSVDWLERVPDMIAEALEHIKARHNTELRLTERLTDLRDTSDNDRHRLQAVGLLRVVTDCSRRHMQLQSRLMEAGAVFRREQDRQQFTATRAATQIDLHAQLLMPLLQTPVEQADEVLTGWVESSLTAVPRLIRVVDLVTDLLNPAEERDTLGETVDEPDLADPDPVGRFDEQTWTELEALLEDQLDEPRRLSQLLAAARTRDPYGDLPALVVLRAVAAFSPGIGSDRKRGERTVVLAVDDGRVLDDPEYGGADLLLSVVDLTATVSPADHTDSDTPGASTGAPGEQQQSETDLAATAAMYGAA